MKIFNEIFGVSKDVKSFVEIQMTNGNKKRNNTSFNKVKKKKMIGTQWKVRYTQRSLHMHAYIWDILAYLKSFSDVFPPLHHV